MIQWILIQATYQYIFLRKILSVIYVRKNDGSTNIIGREYFFQSWIFFDQLITK